MVGPVQNTSLRGLITDLPRASVGALQATHLADAAQTMTSRGVGLDIAMMFAFGRKSAPAPPDRNRKYPVAEGLWGGAPGPLSCPWSVGPLGSRPLPASALICP